MFRSQTTLSLTLLMLMIALTLVSCSSGSNPVDSTGSNDSTNDNNRDGAAAQARIVQAYHAPQELRALGESSASLCAEAVFFASQATGGTQLVVNGTLTQSGSNSNQFSYSPTPSDRLRIAFADGSVTELIVSSFDGDFSRGAETFLKRDHQLAFAVKRTGTADMQIASQQSNRSRQGMLRGSFTLDGVTYNADITLLESTLFDTGGSFAEYESESSITGTIAAPGLSITASEGYRYKSIFNSSENRFVENLTRTINTSWTSGDTKYAIVDGRVRRAMLNGAPTDVDSFWDASGTITRDGTAVGQLSGAVEGNRIRVHAQVDGDRIELEEYAL